MMSLVKRHSVAIVLAIACGLLSAGPFILFASLSPSSEMVVYPELTNDQDFYLSRIQEVRDRVGLGNSYLYEYKSVPTVQLLTGEYVEAFVLDMLNVSTGASLILFPLILLPITFLLMYSIFLVLGASRLWALFATSTLVFWLYFSVFARPISPQFNFIFWLLAALSLFVLIKSASWRAAFLSALSYGALFYIYPYYWTHFTVVYGFLFLVYLYLDRTVAVRIFVAGLGGVIAGGGYFYTLFEARSLPIYQETLERLGLTYTHFPSGGLVAVGATLFLMCAAVLLIRAGRIHASSIVSFALVLGGLVAMNQHLITGMNLEFSSHYTMQILLSSLFLFLSLASTYQWSLGKDANRFFSFACVVALILLATPSISAPYLSAHTLAKDADHRERAEVVRWLQNNVPRENVVYAEEKLAKLIPAHTSLNVFYARAANFFFMPESDVRDRALIQNLNATLTPEYVEAHQREFFGQRYMNPWHHATRKSQLIGWAVAVPIPEKIPQEVYANLKERHEQIKSVGFMSALEKYRVDVVVLSAVDPADALVEDLDGQFELKTPVGQYSIYARD